MSAFVLCAATAAVPVALAFTSRVLVPARLSVAHGCVVSAILAAAVLPFVVALDTVAPWWMWSYVPMAAAPILAGLYLRNRARTDMNHLLGFRAANELAIWAMCIALTASIGMWGWARAE
jgi:hypothetical protein